MTIVPIKKEVSPLPQNPDHEPAPTNEPTLQPTENTPPDRFESGGASLKGIVEGNKQRQ